MLSVRFAQKALQGGTVQVSFCLRKLAKGEKRREEVLRYKDSKYTVYVHYGGAFNAIGTMARNAF